MKTKKAFLCLVSPFFILGLGCHPGELENDVAKQDVSMAASTKRYITVEIENPKPIAMVEEPLDAVAQAPIVDVGPDPGLGGYLDPGLVSAQPFPPFATGYYDESYKFARSVFAPHPDVHPMRSNYIGSYSMIPSRYGDAGPFLYSFDVDLDNFRGHAR